MGKQITRQYNMEFKLNAVALIKHQDSTVPAATESFGVSKSNFYTSSLVNRACRDVACGLPSSQFTTRATFIAAPVLVFCSDVLVSSWYCVWRNLGKLQVIDTTVAATPSSVRSPPASVQGKAWKEAVRLASAVKTLVVTQKSAQPPLLHRSDVCRFLERVSANLGTFETRTLT